MLSRDVSKLKIPSVYENCTKVKGVVTKKPLTCNGVNRYPVTCKQLIN